MDFANIFHIDIACVGKEALLDQVGIWVAQSEDENSTKVITYVNAHCLNISARDADYCSVLQRADLVYTDGIGAVWATRYLTGKILTKLTGADWIYDFFRLAEQHHWRIFILAGKPDVAGKVESNLNEAYPHLEIAGIHHGYLNKHIEQDMVAEINACSPDVLFVGMGTPKQEKWVAVHKNTLNAKVCWSIGALFDYVAGEEPRAPYWMRFIGFEWLWRMLVDPIGKWKRYLVGNIQFVARTLYQKWSVRQQGKIR